MLQKTQLLGERPISKGSFTHLDAVFREFETKEFKESIEDKKSEAINQALLTLIQKEAEPCFLLPSVLGFIERVDQKKLLEHYGFNSFEAWLNQFSGLSFEENFRVRGKIAGKWIDRSAYQALFPIGMGKIYEGTHFVTAHKSPDLDTTIASFWGWLDAFAARVGDGQHVWNLPGGPPASQIEIDWLFRNAFGPAVFSHLPKTRTSLTLTGNDLISQKGLFRLTLDRSIATIDHDEEKNAVVIVDFSGFYLGDWRGSDVEGVQQVIILLSMCLRWFENHLHLQLITLFAKQSLRLEETETPLKTLFGLLLKECEPTREFSAKQKEQTENFAIHVLGLEKGLDSTFDELCITLAEWGHVPFSGLSEILKKIEPLFDANGLLIENRPHIFHFLEDAVKTLHEAIFKIRSRLEKLDVALKIKKDVFGHRPTFVTARAEVDEIREKMGNYSYLTVANPDSGRLFPLGVVRAVDIRRPILGSVSLRDFCNRDEMGIPSYLEVISVIDHHKTSLHTFSAPMAIIADAQSSNSLVAERSFEINRRYSLLGQSEQEIDKQIGSLESDSKPKSRRLLMRLLERRRASEMKGSFFVHPDREYLEYLHFLYGILDDTDLLSKVSSLDVEIVVQLLNRLKSLSERKEVEIIHLDDLPRDKHFPKKAAQRILQNEDMYSLYERVYAYREKEVQRNIELCAAGKSSNLFADTKEHNGCCRVGQTKMFAGNINFYEKHAEAIRRFWLKAAQLIHKEKPEIDFHMHMMSTIVSAEEVYRGIEGKYDHKDELWIWSSGDDVSIEHLMVFLNNFKNSPGLKNNSLEVEFFGANGAELAGIFRESFLDVPLKKTAKPDPELPISVLRFNAGSINSRKAMVAPFLPTLNK